MLLKEFPHRLQVNAERGEERLHGLHGILVPEPHEFLCANLAERGHEGRKAAHLKEIGLRVATL